MIVLTRSDGKEAEFPLDNSPFEPSSLIQACSYDVEHRRVQFVTTRGDSVMLEMPDESGRSIRGDRAVVYLDQNQWSIVAASLYRPDDLRQSERAAAHALVSLALHHKVILPMSFGHMSETCQWTDAEKRYQLGLTMGQLSRGWQVRDPLQVRELELRHSFARSVATECVLPIDAVTLAPNAICSGRESSVPSFSGVAGAPPSMEYDFAYLLAASGNIDTLMDANAEPRGGNPGWVARNEQFRDWLRANAHQSQQRRKATRAFFLADTSGEIASAAARAGLSPEQVTEWMIRHAETEIAGMPALGLYGEAIHDKSVNAAAAWEENDLTDLLYLSCAAGYADHVVCERETAGVLRQGAQRLRRPLSVHRSLEHLVASQDIASLVASLTA